ADLAHLSRRARDRFGPRRTARPVGARLATCNRDRHRRPLVALPGDQPGRARRNHAPRGCSAWLVWPTSVWRWGSGVLPRRAGIWLAAVAASGRPVDGRVLGFVLALSGRTGRTCDVCGPL